MTLDLFSADDRLEKLPMQGAEVFYQPALELGMPLDMILSRLIMEVPWRAETVTVWGKSYPQPRLIAWYGEEGKDYTYSGIHLNPLPWTQLLRDLKSKIEEIANVQFNSLLLNYYRNNRDSMGLHSDDEPELGKRPIIASLSIGEERTFIFKHKTDKAMKPLRVRLSSGSLLIMKGDTQQNWKHGIDKETRPCGPRVNLTFRQIGG